MKTRVRHIRAIFLVMAFMMCISGCGEPEKKIPANIFLELQEVSLSCNGKVLFMYNADKCQFSYKTDNMSNVKELRVFDDDMKNYYIVKSMDIPEETGQVLNADLEYCAGGESKSLDNLSFTVKKIGKDGNIWLWNEDLEYGVLIMKIGRQDIP